MGIGNNLLKISGYYNVILFVFVTLLGGGLLLGFGINNFQKASSNNYKKINTGNFVMDTTCNGQGACFKQFINGQQINSNYESKQVCTRKRNSRHGGYSISCTWKNKAYVQWNINGKLYPESRSVLQTWTSQDEFDGNDFSGLDLEYNPDYPDVYRTASMSKTSSVLMIVFGLILLLMSISGMYCLRNKGCRDGFAIFSFLNSMIY